MALVNLLNMVVLDNPTSFTNPFQFEITFECLQELDDDLEWSIIYVTSANDTTRDQILDEILVGPVPVGINKFVLQSDPPDPKSIPQSDILGVTVVLVTCKYREREFVRVGYYVNNELIKEGEEGEGEAEREGETVEQQQQRQQRQVEEWKGDVSKVVREILADKPRVTRFPIDWGDGTGGGGDGGTDGMKENGMEEPRPTGGGEDEEDRMDADVDDEAGRGGADDNEEDEEVETEEMATE